MPLRKADIEWLPLRALTPHSMVQRRLINARVKHLSSNFNPDGLGIFTVWQEGHNRWIIDGQHRWRAGMDTGHGDTKVQCKVYRNAELSDMAALFLLLDDTRSVAAFDKFKVGLLAGDARCHAVDRIVRAHGLEVSNQTRDGTVRCIDKLFDLYDRDPALLAEVLAVATAAWGTRKAAVENVVIVSLGKVLGHYDGALDKGALVARLAKYKGGPAGLIGNARSLADVKPISTTRAAAEIIVDTYNSRRRNGALAPL